MIAALYVQHGGCYFGLRGVVPFDVSDDARLYVGPWPVVAHPPCQRWGSRWWWLGRGKPRGILGNDGGCFESALNAVRKWGGVLEHPAGSRAWARFGLPRPPKQGGWIRDEFGGWTCHVEQGHYGHRAPKPTWLYFVPGDVAIVPFPALKWGPSGATGRVDFMSGDGRERSATPLPFRDLLLSMARSVRAREAA